MDIISTAWYGHNAMIVMQWICNDYEMDMWSCSHSFMWVSLVVGWWVIVYSLCFKLLCLETLWTCKREFETDESLYSTGAYSLELHMWYLLRLYW